MENDKTIFWIIGLVIVGVLLYNYSGFFGITLSSAETQYNNKDIKAEFSLANYTNPSIQIFFNDEEILELDVNETNDTVSFTRNLVNGTYDFTIKDINKEGFLKIVVSENNITETKVINVQDPHVALTHNILNVAEKGDSLKILVSTLNPQGELLIADSVVIDVTTPDNNLEIITLTKSGDTFEYNFNYEQSGTYQFKIKASKIDYKTKEVSAVTTVIKTGGIPLVVWIWIVAIIIFILFFIIKQIRIRS